MLNALIKRNAEFGHLPPGSSRGQNGKQSIIIKLGIFQKMLMRLASFFHQSLPTNDTLPQAQKLETGNTDLKLNKLMFLALLRFVSLTLMQISMKHFTTKILFNKNHVENTALYVLKGKVPNVKLL